MIRALVVVALALAITEAAPGKKYGGDYDRPYYHHGKQSNDEDRPEYHHESQSAEDEYYKYTPYEDESAEEEAVTETEAPESVYIDISSNSTSEEEQGPVGDVVDVAINAGTFTTLLNMVKDLDLVNTLKYAEAVTIFAPSDEAFDKLPRGLMESLSTEEAKDIIKRHLVMTKLTSEDIETGPLETYGGETIALYKTYRGVEIDYNSRTSNVVTADVEATNGVIHVIDSVIM